MIRTTVRLEDSTFKEARKKAIDNGISFTDLVNQALKNYLKLKPASKKTEFKIYNLFAKTPLSQNRDVGEEKVSSFNISKHLSGLSLRKKTSGFQPVKAYNMGKIKGNLSRLEIYEDLG